MASTTKLSLKQLEQLLARARSDARKAGIRKADLKTAISRVRRRTK